MTSIAISDDRWKSSPGRNSKESLQITKRIYKAQKKQVTTNQCEGFKS
jgi:hypothetical protein